MRRMSSGSVDNGSSPPAFSSAGVSLCAQRTHSLRTYVEGRDDASAGGTTHFCWVAARLSKSLFQENSQRLTQFSSFEQAPGTRHARTYRAPACAKKPKKLDAIDSVKLSFFSHSASVSSSLGELCSGAASLAAMFLTSGGLVNPIGNGALFCVKSVPPLHVRTMSNGTYKGGPDAAAADAAKLKGACTALALLRATDRVQQGLQRRDPTGTRTGSCHCPTPAHWHIAPARGPAAGLNHVLTPLACGAQISRGAWTQTTRST